MNRVEINFLKTNGYYPFPKTLQIEITRRCPFHCSQCYKQKLECIDMNYSHVMNFLEMIKQKDVKQFVLNGGEPLLYPNIVPLLKQISSMETSVNIFTSGYGLTKEIINILKTGKNISFYISLNGSTQEINSQSREGYEYAINAATMLAAENAVYGINWVARHDNAPDFVNMITLCQEYNAVYLSVISSKLTGKNEMGSPLTKNDLELIAEQINKKRDSSTLILIDSCFSMLSVHVDAPKSGFGTHCYAGISNCNINCDLTFQPCTHLKRPEQFETIDRYWHSSMILKSLRTYPAYTLKPCQCCGHNKVCSICRAMSIDTYTDYEIGISTCINFSEVNDKCMI